MKYLFFVICLILSVSNPSLISPLLHGHFQSLGSLNKNLSYNLETYKGSTITVWQGNVRKQVEGKRRRKRRRKLIETKQIKPVSMEMKFLLQRYDMLGCVAQGIVKILR